MSFTAITVTGRYLAADESTGLVGLVEFRLSTAMQNSLTDEIIPPSKVRAGLGPAGEISVVLAATNDPGTSPLGAVYEVTERIVGARTRTYKIAVPFDAPDGTFDLADAAPVTDVVYQHYSLVGHTHPELGIGGGTAPDATPTVKGVVRLAGDLAGTASTPTVPGLATKETPAGAQAKADAAAAASIPLVQKAAPSGVASLDPTGVVPDGQLPAGLTRDSELTAAIQAAIDALLAGAPAALDTLNELAAAVNDDATFAASVTTALAGKQPLDADLTAIAALATTTFGRSLLELVSAAAGRTALGLGTAATRDTGTGAAQVVLGDDTRLSDQRVPPDGTVTPAKFGTVPIDTLSDIDTTTAAPATGDGFAWNGTLWVPRKRIYSGTLANRATVVPSPVEGDQYDATDDDGGTRYVYRSGAWAQVAAGVLETGGRELANGYAEITANQTGITSTTGTDITGLTITPTVGARPILVRAQIAHLTLTAGTPPLYAACFLLEGATIVGRAYARMNGAVGTNNVATVTAMCRRTPAAGAGTTYKAQLWVQSGATVTVNADPTDPSFIQATEL